MWEIQDAQRWTTFPISLCLTGLGQSLSSSISAVPLVKKIRKVYLQNGEVRLRYVIGSETRKKTARQRLPLSFKFLNPLPKPGPPGWAELIQLIIRWPHHAPCCSSFLPFSNTASHQPAEPRLGERAGSQTGSRSLDPPGPWLHSSRSLFLQQLL